MCTQGTFYTIATPARVGRALKVEHASSCSDVTRDATLFFISSTDCFLSRFAKFPVRRCTPKVRYANFSACIFSKSRYLFFLPTTLSTIRCNFIYDQPVLRIIRWQLVGERKGEKRKKNHHRFKIIAREKNLETRFRSRPTIRLGKGYNNGGWPRKIFRSFRSLARDFSIERFIISTTVSVDSREIENRRNLATRFDSISPRNVAADRETGT